MLDSHKRKNEGEKSNQFLLHLLRMAELPAQPLPRTIHTPPHAVLVALHTARRTRAVVALSPGLHFVDEVAGAAAPNVVHGCLLAAQTLLLLQLLVEGEHGAFATLHVACAAAASGVHAVGWR